MGWPIGWTALEPLATDRFRQWLAAHQCATPAGDEYGNAYCVRVRKLDADLAKLREERDEAVRKLGDCCYTEPHLAVAQERDRLQADLAALRERHHKAIAFLEHYHRNDTVCCNPAKCDVARFLAEEGK